jgi:hypothetical protein
VVPAFPCLVPKARSRLRAGTQSSDLSTDPRRTPRRGDGRPLWTRCWARHVPIRGPVRVFVFDQAFVARRARLGADVVHRLPHSADRLLCLEAARAGEGGQKGGQRLPAGRLLCCPGMEGSQEQDKGGRHGSTCSPPPRLVSHPPVSISPPCAPPPASLRITPRLPRPRSSPLASPPSPAPMGSCLSGPVDYDGEVNLYHFDLHRAVGRGAFGKVGAHQAAHASSLRLRSSC